MSVLHRVPILFSTGHNSSVKVDMFLISITSKKLSSITLNLWSS